MDIIIFAAIAAFLIYRLNSVLGTRNGTERPRQNPFLGADPAAAKPALQIVPPALPRPPSLPFEQLVDADANKDGRVESGLIEIAAADAQFEPGHFISGARQAFGLIIEAFNRGDIAALAPLLSPKLFADFTGAIDTRKNAGETLSVNIQRIVSARVIEAHLGGTMAYVTVDFKVEEISVTKDASGKVISGDPDRILTVDDIWTFTRDTRSSDPNWLLIETRTAENA